MNKHTYSNLGLAPGEHPGRAVLIHIRRRGLTIATAAAEIGMSSSVLRNVVNGLVSMYPGTALLIEQWAPHLKAHDLVHIQADHYLHLARRRADDPNWPAAGMPIMHRVRHEEEAAA
ncbi:hypothetical protein [Cupriavidus sp. TMH.W2]|uniref:hypothetical protein n=1 Tax=Cupriavidus sp. TMH.W2 TaxID=3434465 RepID=UPI003D777A4E